MSTSPNVLEMLKLLKIHRDKTNRVCLVLTITVTACHVFYWCSLLRFFFTIKRFHMTSRRPCWRSKTKEWRPWSRRTKLILRELNSIFYVNTSFCFSNPTWRLVTWVKTLYYYAFWKYFSLSVPALLKVSVTLSCYVHRLALKDVIVLSASRCSVQKKLPSSRYLWFASAACPVLSSADVSAFTWVRLPQV